MKIFPHLESNTLTNQYLVINEETREGILIDCPMLDTHMIRRIEEEKVDLKAVLLTEGHDEHASGLGTLFKIYDPEVYTYFPRVGDIKAREVKDGETLEIAGFEVHSIHVPGHSLDSLCWRIEGAIFTGETLLSGEIGETPGLIEKEVLIRSIKEKLMTLDDKTVVYPGHGPLTKIRIEKYFNQDLLEGDLMFSE